MMTRICFAKLVEVIGGCQPGPAYCPPNDVGTTGAYWSHPCSKFLKAMIRPPGWTRKVDCKIMIPARAVAAGGKLSVSKGHFET